MKKVFVGLMGMIFLLSAISCGSADTGTSPGGSTPPSEVRFFQETISPVQVVLRWGALTGDATGTEDGTKPATITGYVVKYKIGDENSASNYIKIDEKSEGVRLSKELTGAERTTTVIGLSPGITYTFLIAAVNSGGATTSDAQAAKKTVTTTGSMPASEVKLAVDNSASTSNQVMLRWTAPTDPGIDAEGNIATISGYIVKYRTADSDFIEIDEFGEGEGVRLAKALTDSSTNAIVSNLSPSTAYTFLVAAVNSVGTTPDEDAAKIEHTTPAEGATAPSIVMNLTVDVDSITSSQMVLSWIAPADPGTTDGVNKATISKYIVKYKIADSDLFVEINENSEKVRLSTALTSTSTTATVLGLSANTRYTFHVAAVNSGSMVGPNGPNAEVTGTTTREEVGAATPPSAVKELKVDFITNDYVVLSWIEPDDMGTIDGNTLAELSKYVVEYKESTNNDFILIDKTGNGVRLSEAWANTNTTAMVTNLEANTEYIFRVAAVNSGGKTGSKEPVTGTTKEAATDSSDPSAVIDLGSSSTHDQVTLSWTAPSDPGTDENGNSFTISTYIVKYKKTADNNFVEIDDNSQGVRLSTQLTNTSTGVTVIGLDPNTEYSFSVSAVNSGSKVGPEATINQRTAVLPAVPATPTGLSIKSVLTCNKIVGVDLTWSATPGAASYKLYRDNVEIQESITTSSYTDKPAPGSHRYTVQACNSDGCSGKSTPTEAVTIDGNSFASIVYRGVVPADADLIKYNKEIQDVFSLPLSRNADGSLVPRYKAGASLVARYVKLGGDVTKVGTSYEDASGSLKAVMEGITDASADKVYVVFLEGGLHRIGDTTTMTPIVMKNHVAIVGGVNDECLTSNTLTSLYAKNLFRVFENVDNNLNNTALLYRLRIANGNADGDAVTVEKGKGGGMYNRDSSPALIRVTFSGNAAMFGGGMYNEKGSSPTLTEVLFSANSVLTGGAGGAVYNENSSPTLTRVTFRTNNTKSGKGGAMYNDGSSPLIVGATFSGNTAAGTTVGNGGAIYNSKSSPTLVGVTFKENTATRYGGAMFNDNDGAIGPVIVNGIFWDNTASGGAQFAISTANTGQENLGIYNSIVQGATNEILLTGGTAPVSISSANIDDSDPLLAGLDSYSLSTDFGGKILTYAISSTSPAVDKGLYFKKKNTSSYYSEDGSTWYPTPALGSGGGNPWPAPGAPRDADDLTATDARGYARAGVGSRPDIGAYEHNGGAPQ